MKQREKLLFLQFADIPLGRIEGMRVDAARAQRLQHAGAGHQRNLALGR
jgi:hypothetical protein